MRRSARCSLEMPASPATSNVPCWSAKIVDRSPNGIASKPGSRYIRRWTRCHGRGQDRFLPARRSRTIGALGALGRQAGAPLVPPCAIPDRRLVQKTSLCKSCPYPCTDFQRGHMTGRYFLCVEDRATSVGSRMMVRARGICSDSIRLSTSSAARWPIIWLC